MNSFSDSELQEIVHRVVKQAMGGGSVNPFPGSSENNTSPESESRVDDILLDSDNGRRIAIGADHGGFMMKEDLKNFLHENGYQVDDCGTYSTDSVDYPDFAYAVANKVGNGLAWRGIIIDGAGIGSCMAANKVPGVRAAMCYDHATAVNSREHNAANVLTLGAGLIGLHLARQIVITWVDTEFAGGRHSRRVSKIMNIERK
jgi:RpiB/LacA/LacB family sugar-phosphate isomerase